MTVTQRDPMTVVAAADVVTVTFPGHEPVRERCTRYPADGYELWISDGYSRADADEYAMRLREHVAQAPRELRRHLTIVAVMASNAPDRPNGIACAQCPGMLTFWQIQLNDDRPYITQDIVDHELAHLAGDDGRPPADMGDLWTLARRGDARHSAALCEAWSDGAADEGTFDFLAITLRLGHEWLSDRCEREAASNGEAEDWATSVSCHLHCLRGGSLARFAGRPYTFADLYPNRARTIDIFLGDHDAAGARG